METVKGATCSREIQKGKFCHNCTNFVDKVRAKIRIQQAEDEVEVKNTCIYYSGI